jgi:hypothetical protein
VAGAERPGGGANEAGAFRPSHPRSRGQRLLGWRFISSTAFAPTFEVHVNNPINHRDVFNRFDIAGTPDVVNLTYGINFELHRRSLVTLALVTPVLVGRCG